MTRRPATVAVTAFTVVCLLLLPPLAWSIVDRGVGPVAASEGAASEYDCGGAWQEVTWTGNERNSRSADVTGDAVEVVNDPESMSRGNVYANETLLGPAPVEAGARVVYPLPTPGTWTIRGGDDRVSVIVRACTVVETTTTEAPTTTTTEAVTETTTTTEAPTTTVPTGQPPTTVVGVPPADLFIGCGPDDGTAFFESALPVGTWTIQTQGQGFEYLRTVEVTPEWVAEEGNWGEYVLVAETFEGVDGTLRGWVYDQAGAVVWGDEFDSAPCQATSDTPPPPTVCAEGYHDAGAGVCLPNGESG